MVFEKLVVIDCRGHLMGRLASIIAKELLLGQRVVAVRCESLEISGAIWRNEVKFRKKAEKKCNVNPERGPFRFRKPAVLLKRMVRGMVPHKTQRGQAALARLKCYEGIPHPYDRIKRKVVPEALRVLRLRPGRKSTVLGKLASKFGWNHGELIETLEEKRKVKSAAYYEKKKADLALRAQAEQEADIPESVKATLAQYGY